MSCQLINNNEEKKWYVFDISDKPLGRSAAICASILRGKHKPCYTLNRDFGDYVVVINADKAKMTGNKAKTKEYIHHSGYIGGLKRISYQDMLTKHPTRAFEMAVKGMLPHNTLGKQMFKKLKVYSSTRHEHEAQKPVDIEQLNILWSQKVR